MKSKFILSVASFIGLSAGLFCACSDNASVAGTAEEPNQIAVESSSSVIPESSSVELIESSPCIAVRSSSSENLSSSFIASSSNVSSPVYDEIISSDSQGGCSSSALTNDVLSEQNKIVMDSILNVFGKGPNGGPASIPSEGYVPTPTTSSSKTVNLFKSTGISYYSYLNEFTYRFCRINIYEAENGVRQEIRLQNRTLVNSTIFVNSEKNLYKVGAIANYYMETINSCKDDSLKYVQHCIDNNGAYRDYNRGCYYKHLQMACVLRSADKMNLDSTATLYQQSCENAALEIDYVPETTKPDTLISCTGAYGYGNDDGETCDTSIVTK